MGTSFARRCRGGVRLGLTMLLCLAPLCLAPLCARAQGPDPSAERLRRWSAESRRPSAGPTFEGRALEEARLPTLHELWCRSQPPSCACGDGPSPPPGNGRHVLRRLRRCVEGRLRRDPSELSGRLVVEVRIGRRGRAQAVRVVENTTGDPRLAACLERVLAALWLGPSYRAEEPATVTWPIAFGSGGAR